MDIKNGTFSKNKQSSSLIQGLGKVPPNALDLEKAVLGALMIEKGVIDQVADILHIESFYKDSHQKIYSAIVELFKEGEPIDMLTVIEQLRRNGDYDLVGGSEKASFYISQLTIQVNSAAHITTHSRIIAEKAMKRELISIASEIEKDAYEDTGDVFELLDKMQQNLFDISERSIKRNYSDIKSLMHKAIDALEEKRGQTDGLTGVPSGFTKLDRLTSGWQKSDLVIMAARPGMGKTSLVLSAARNAAVEFGQGVAIFSLEMAAVQLVMRLISIEAHVEGQKIKNGDLSDAEWQRVIEKTAKLSAAPLFIDDTPAISILELRSKCRRLKTQHDIQLIIIDYLQLMTGDGGGKGGGNREQEIASISRSLKQLAKELEVPVIALAQLSRAVETRGGDKKPMLSDLRESGSIEQDADQVMFIYRPEYYKITEDEEGNSTLNVAEIIIAKNRHGSAETVKLKFEGQFTKFSDLDEGFGGDGFDDFQSYEMPNTGAPEDFGNQIIDSKMNDSTTDSTTDSSADLPPFPNSTGEDFSFDSEPPF